MARSRPSAIFKELEDMLQCALCLEMSHDPRTLPCLHWYCTSCIQKLIDTSKFPSKFHCPQCRSETPRPDKGATYFPIAFFVNKIDEAVRKRKETKSKKHVMCSEHKKPLDAYCATCQQRLCITCMLAHDGHGKLMISKLQIQMEKPITDTIQEMQKLVQEFEAELIKLSEAKHISIYKGEVQTKALKDHGNKLMNQLQQTLDKMEQQIGEHVSATVCQYESNENTLKTEMSKRAEAILQMEAYLKDKGPSDILDLEPYKALIQNRNVCKPIHEMKIDLRLSDLSKLTDELLVGTVTGFIDASEPQVVSMTSEVLPTTGLHIEKTHEFDLPCSPGGIACNQEGNVAVCGFSDQKVHIFTQEGEKLSEISPGGRILDVAAAKNRWYITQYDDGQLCIYDTKGHYIDTVSVGYKGKGGVAVSDLHLYVTSAKENFVYRLDLPNGSNKKVFIRNSLFSKKYLDYPMFVATNGKCVAVSSNHSHQVSLFDMTGTRLFVYGREGSGPGQLRSPWGVAIDGMGRVQVADFGNKRISILSSEGHHLLDIEPGPNYFPSGLALTGNDKTVVSCEAFMRAPKKVLIYQCAK